MSTVRIYKYELFDAIAREFVRQRQLATAEAIALMRGVVMHTTGRDVPAGEVSASGIWQAVSVDASILGGRLAS